MPDQKPRPTIKCITASFARTQFGQILDRAGSNQERFVVTKNGQETIVILGIEDFLQVLGNLSVDLLAGQKETAEGTLVVTLPETK